MKRSIVFLIVILISSCSTHRIDTVLRKDCTYLGLHSKESIKKIDSNICKKGKCVFLIKNNVQEENNKKAYASIKLIQENKHYDFFETYKCSLTTI